MLISETIALAVRHHRERLDLSQAELARRMKAQGFPWYPATVARTESADRPLRLDEAVTLAGVLELRVQDLYALPEMSDPEIDQLKEELEEAYAKFHDARVTQITAEGYIGVHRDRLQRAQLTFEKAQQEYHAAVATMADAESTLKQATATVGKARIRVDDLRAKFERLQRKAQQAALLRYLKPGDEITVTIEDVEPARTRFTKRADGVVYELVNKDGEMVLQSQPFENEQIAKERAERFFEKYATDRSREPEVLPVLYQEGPPNQRYIPVLRKPGRESDPAEGE